jgi:carboxypeptidase T
MPDPRRLIGPIAAGIVGVVASLATPGIGSAEEPATATGQYEGFRLVRAEPRSRAQLERALELSRHCLNCRIGVGPVDLLVAPEAWPALRATGMRLETRHRNVQQLIDAERERLAARARRPGGGVAGVPDDPCADIPGWFEEFKPLADIEERLLALQAARPDLVELLEVGTSIEGRAIHGARITSPAGAPDRPAVLLNGCQHGREWIAPMVPMFIATMLVCDADADEVAALLEQVQFIIVPVVNPDGYEHSWSPSGDRFWRKNRRDNLDGTHGVDLNRNWGTDWNGGESTSTDSGNDLYVGPEPFSEPETLALRDFILARPNIAAHIDFHSYSQVILQAWAHTNELPEDHPAIDDLGERMRQAALGVQGVNYPHSSGEALLYLASGVLADWSHDVADNFAFTVEMRPTSGENGGFELPPEQILPTCQEAFRMALSLAAWTAAGVQFTVPGGLPPVVAANEPASFLTHITPTGADAIVPDSARVRVRLQGEEQFDVVPLVPVGGTAFDATLPAAPCGARLQLYLEVQAVGGTWHRLPGEAPSAWHTALVREPDATFVDDFETDLGWTIENGPGRNSDVDGGATTLVSPPLDAEHPEARISYEHWYSNHTGGNPNEDVFLVEISADGGEPWVVVEEVLGNADGWVHRSVRVADHVTPGPSVRIRFTASDLGGGSVVEAGVDTVQVVKHRCPAGPADLDGDGLVDVDDLLELILGWGECNGSCPTDLNGDGVVDVDDLLLLILAWSF